MIDNTKAARMMSHVNASLCSHRFKRTNGGRIAVCEDCGKQLYRDALPRRTGKTARKRGEDPKRWQNAAEGKEASSE